jgi:hypothetical protein
MEQRKPPTMVKERPRVARRKTGERDVTILHKLKRRRKIEPFKTRQRHSRIPKRKVQTNSRKENSPNLDAKQNPCKRVGQNRRGTGTIKTLVENLQTINSVDVENMTQMRIGHQT